MAVRRDQSERGPSTRLALCDAFLLLRWCTCATSRPDSDSYVCCFHWMQVPWTATWSFKVCPKYKKCTWKLKKIWTRQKLEALYRRDFDVVEICWRLRHETIPWWWTLGGWERPPAEISSGETRSSRGWTLVQVSWVDLARTPSCIADSALRRRALITKPNTSPVNNGRCYTECSISAIRDTFSSHRFWLLQPWLSVLFLFFLNNNLDRPISNRSRVSCACTQYVEGINSKPVTLKSGLTVTQGHWNWYHSKVRYDFLFAFYSNNGVILYCVRNIAIYWSKIATFLYPTLYLAPLQEVTPSEFRQCVWYL